MARVAVFASGSGTNLQALIDRLNAHDTSPASVALVVSDRSDAGALSRAESARITRCVIPVAGRDPREVSDRTIAILREHDIHIIALAGYLKLVPAEVVQQYRGRIVNIHPALLPAFGGKGMYGMRVHRAVLEAGCLVTGVTVHHVDERYDEGKPILQWPVPVVRGDTPESLAARVLQAEHVVYPIAIAGLAAQLAAGEAAIATTRRAGFDANAASNPFTLSATADLEREVRRALAISPEGMR